MNTFGILLGFKTGMLLGSYDFFDYIKLQKIEK